MRPLLTAFLLLSPLIALAQNYPVHQFAHLPATHIAHAVADAANVASVRVSAVVHAVQALFA